MNDMELAEEIERHMSNRPWGFIIPPYPLYEADAKQIIAALRRGPERPPSGEMVMVSKDALEGFVRTLQKQIGQKARGDITPQRVLELARAMLSAAEASKEAK